MRIVDLCDIENYDKYSDQFDRLKSQITEGSDRLRNNYQDIVIKDFLSFTVMLEQQEDKIIAFSGLQFCEKRWGARMARILSRYYIVPDWRGKYTMFDPTETFAFAMFGHQMSVAKKMNLSCVFLSRETHRKAFAKFIDCLNAKYSLNIEFLPGKYRVCGNNNYDPSCVQYIAKLDLKNDDVFFLPRVEDE